VGIYACVHVYLSSCQVCVLMYVSIVQSIKPFFDCHHTLYSRSPVAFVSMASIVSMYPVGVPVMMHLIMRYQYISVLARKKTKSSLITYMISTYTKSIQDSTATSSSITLALFLGMPPSLKPLTLVRLVYCGQRGP